MKRFKKVLALVLAGVLALAMLTGCKISTDKDALIPPDGSFEIYQAINDEAVKQGKAEVKYSVKYSEATKELLTNWLENKAVGSESAYKAGYQKVVKELGNAQIVVGLIDENTYPRAASTSSNPGYKSSAFSASTFVNDSNYTSATHIGIAFVQTKDGQTYRLVCLYRVPNQ